MENKSLNIFNSRLVLATPATATDGDYNAIESVVGCAVVSESRAESAKQSAVTRLTPPSPAFSCQTRAVPQLDGKPRHLPRLVRCM